MNSPHLFIIKHKDHSFVQRKLHTIMNTIDFPEDTNNSGNLSNPDKLSTEMCHAMALVAKMRESADKVGAGFVGGFITPDGQYFMSSNVDEDDTQYKAIKERIDHMQRTQRMNIAIESKDASADTSKRIAEFKKLIQDFEDWS